MGVYLSVINPAMPSNLPQAPHEARGVDHHQKPAIALESAVRNASLSPELFPSYFMSTMVCKLVKSSLIPSSPGLSRESVLAAQSAFANRPQLAWRSRFLMSVRSGYLWHHDLLSGPISLWMFGYAPSLGFKCRHPSCFSSFPF